MMVFKLLLYWILVLFGQIFQVTKGQEIADSSSAIPGFTEIVYPIKLYYNFPTKDVIEVTFELKYGSSNFHINLRTRQDKLDGDSACHMEGFVSGKEFYHVELAVCNGIVGTISRNLTKSVVIKPLFEENEQVTLDNLSTTPHIISVIDSIDESSIFSNFIPHELVEESRTRSIRGIKMATIVPINRAEGVVYHDWICIETDHFWTGRNSLELIICKTVGKMYYMNPSTHKRQYFSRLRNNEKNFIRSAVGTTWLAYDENQKPLLLNSNYNLLILQKHVDDNFDVLITSPRKTKKVKEYKKAEPRYLLIHITADESFLKKHPNKKAAIEYINGLVKGVNMMFRHKSLDADFYVLLEGINFIKDSEIEIQLRYPKNSLKNACAKMFDFKKENKSLKFHFGLFLTRRKFGYSGFTPLYRMCVPYKSCAAVYDSGLRTAFIIAHEIGHSVGLSHDGDHNECAKDVSLGSIMAPQVYSRFDQYFWSNCTRRQIHQNLRYFSCLFKKKPSDADLSVTDLPGVTHNLDEQCKYIFGKKFRACLGKRTPDQYCRYMFCRVPGQQNRCSYLSLPPADGTTCAKNKWCVEGKCIPVGRLSPSPIHGNWSKWSGWSRCSTQCGPGVTKRYRKCNNPEPYHGGRNCNGSISEWKMCDDFTPCHINRIFEDKRNDACYSFGRKWRWFSPPEIEEKARTLNLDLNFEKGFGSWVHDNNTKTKWAIHEGATQTPETGPTIDHTYANKTGKYMYFESSYPYIKGDDAMLVSPVILLPTVCINMYYHMLGKRMGTLRILKLDVNGTELEVLWKRSSSAGQYWYNINVNVSYNKQFKIGIEAVRGSSYLSDIGIDDIEITPGVCNKGRNKAIDPDKLSCRLFCRHPVHNYLQIHKVVPDGLKCNKHSNAICVDGECQKLGCDNQLGSDKQFDKCGICGEGNHECSYQEINLKVNLQKLTQRVLKVPLSAAGFVVTKTTPSDVKLAIRDVSRKASYYYDDVPRTGYNWYYFTINKTTLRYEIPYKRRERIHIDKVNGIDAEILLVSPGPRLKKSTVVNLTYRFYVPVGYNTSTRDDEDDVYSWVFKEWTNCSVPCGGGIKRAVYHCLNLRTKQKVGSGNCSSDAVEIVPKMSACNVEKCVTRYEYGYSRWGRCDLCGRVGNKYRTSYCLMKKQGEEPVNVENKLCSALPPPTLKIKCFRYCAKITKCVERSRLCPKFLKQGYCSYRTVQALCCETCIPKKKKET